MPKKKIPKDNGMPEEITELDVANAHCLVNNIKHTGHCVTCQSSIKEGYFCSELCAEIYLKEAERMETWEQADAMFERGMDWNDVADRMHGKYI